MTAVRHQPDWSSVGTDTHFVQFYDNDAALVPLLSRYVGTSLVAGDAAIVLAGEALREKVAEHLRQMGYNVAVARAQHRYFDLDAAATLPQIIAADWPNAVRFERIVGRLLDAATAGGRRVVVYGDMVALLWAKGQTEAAIYLEELWNELAQKRPFTLGCAYPMSQFSHAQHAAPFVRICSQHSRVFSAGNR